MKFKEEIGNLIKGRQIKITKGCCLKTNIKGICTGFYINTKNSELILKIKLPDNKIIEIGENHPDLEIEFI